MGSTSSAFVCFVLPAVFGLKLDLPEVQGRARGLACRALLFGGATLGIVATTVTISGLVSPDRAPKHAYAPCMQDDWD